MCRYATFTFIVELSPAKSSEGKRDKATNPTYTGSASSNRCITAPASIKPNSGGM